MSIKNIWIPDGMLRAAEQHVMNDSESARLELSTEDYKQISRDAIEAALCWMSENPIVPSSSVLAELASSLPSQKYGTGTLFEHVIAEWQRRMFRTNESIEIKDEECVTLTDGHRGEVAEAGIYERQSGKRLIDCKVSDKVSQSEYPCVIQNNY